MTDDDAQAFYQILASILGGTILALDSLDDALLSLISTNQKLNQARQTQHRPLVLSERDDVEQALARLEFSETWGEYLKKRREFQIHLQHLRRIHADLSNLPYSTEIEEMKEEVDKEVMKKWRQGR